MISISVSLLLALLLALILRFWIRRTYKNSQLPPGPIRWPIIGTIPQMLMTDPVYPHRQVEGLRSTYGNIMSLQFGVHYAVVISSYDMIKDILKRPEATLDRFRFQFADQRTDGENLGLVWCCGETWNKVRKFTVKKLREFGFGKHGSQEIGVREEMESLMTDLREETEGTGGIWKVEPNRLAAVAINIVWRSLSGYRFDPKSKNIQRHIDLLAEVFEVLLPTNLLSVFPFLSHFPKLSGYNRHGEIHRRNKQFMKDLIEEVKLNRGGREEPENFVEMFLDEIEKNQGIPGTTVTEKQLTALLMDLFLAGSETTGTVMNWLILYFALNQDVQKAARAEILRISEGGTKPIPLTASNKMPYILACVYEAMRHPPFVAMPPPRAASSDITYGEYIIPKGACIIYNMYAVLHDPVFWGDHDVFRPERFLDEAGTGLNPEKVERVAPFGFGRRICPGEGIAMDTLVGFVGALLSRFSIEVVEGLVPTTEPGPVSMAIAPRPYSVKLINIY